MIQKKAVHKGCLFEREHSIGGISGTVNAVRLISEQYPYIRTYLNNKKSTSVIEGVLLKKCGELICGGKRFDGVYSGPGTIGICYAEI